MSLLCRLEVVQTCRNCGVPQLHFSNKVDMPVVVNDRCSEVDRGFQCHRSWKKSSVGELIVDSSATDHERNRGGADRGVQCHRSWKKSSGS